MNCPIITYRRRWCATFDIVIIATIGCIKYAIKSCISSDWCNRLKCPPVRLSDVRTFTEPVWCCYEPDGFIFDFIEYFTTAFLRAHSWLNWVELMGN